MKTRGVSSDLHRSLFSKKCFEMEVCENNANATKEARPQSCGRARKATVARGAIEPLDAIKTLSPRTEAGCLTDRPVSTLSNNDMTNRGRAPRYSINDRGYSCQGYVACPSLSARGRIKTNSSLFPSHDEESEAMPVIPISPMFTQRTENSAPNWSSDFFGRGATAVPSSRHQKIIRAAENPLPGLLNSTAMEERLRKASKNKRPITTTRVPTSSSMDISRETRSCEENAALTPPSSSRNSYNLSVSPIIDPPSVLQKGIVPQSARLDSSYLNKSRSRSTSRAKPLHIATRPSTSQVSEVEPWAFKLISKYNSDPSQRPLSRCTSRVKSQKCVHVNGPQLQTYSSKSTPSLHSGINITVTEFG